VGIPDIPAAAVIQSFAAAGENFIVNCAAETTICQIHGIPFHFNPMSKL
jgi:hypothetical protein